MSRKKNLTHNDIAIHDRMVANAFPKAVEPHIVSERVPGEWEALQNTRESVKAERDKEPMFNLARTGKELLPITRAQWEAIKRKYATSQDGAATFQAFVDRVEPAVGMDCIMLPWCGMWLGIERDGHTHS